MGLHGVSAFIRNKYPHLLHREHLSLFAHQRVFVDIASYIYKYVCIFGSGSSKWCNAFFNLILTFRKNSVHIIPVLDGKAPAAKQEEQKDRRDKRQKTKDRHLELQIAIDNYESGDRNSDTIEILQRELESCRSKGIQHVSLVAQKNNNSSSISTSGLITEKDMKDLKKLLSSIGRQTSYLNEDDFKLLRDLLDACGISWLQAPEEAEAYASWLVRNGLGSAVVSCDTDCIAHRADVIIFELDSYKGNITYVNTCELLEAWELDEESIVDFGILCGCDYNPGGRVNKIGPVNAVKLLAKYKRIEDIPNLANIEVLKHELCRKLFNVHYNKENVVIHAGKTDINKMRELAAKREDLDVKQLEELININDQKTKIEIVD